ncbi:MAG TPA: NAD(P)/FAD-dependent oxidoreductase [Solirubrobacteraceae bacterium]|nr:NAD(P)/FAD-dependent oxidoreductase [Solirubrobacteraceae bacterium]
MSSTARSHGSADGSPPSTSHRVVVVGGGFGGLQAVKALGRLDAQITLVDRHNYHLFQPLSYQVATGGLSPAEIATPLRHIFRRQRQVQVLLGEAVGFELGDRQLVVQADVPGGTMTLGYDTLIVAGGSDYSYFGHDEWRETALEVKSLDSALEVRGRILHAFEVAELDPSDQERWLTFVVVGAGPTGVEMAGQIAELAHETLAPEFRRIDPRQGRVVLVETTDKVLGGFPDPLPARAARSLERLGVTLMLGHTVVDVQGDHVELEDGQGRRTQLVTQTVIWAAGVHASPLARMLAEAAGAEIDRSGRLTVESDLSLPGHPEVLALGDMVRVRDASSGEAVALPGLAPVAMQQGRYAARVIGRRLADRPAPGPFHYRDKGSLATIGRARAVADLRGLRFSGILAWAAWLSIHIFFLIGFENRLVVMSRWSYSYFTRGRSSRLITEAAALGEAPQSRS